MSYKMVVSDLDNTLIEMYSKNIPTECVKTINQLADEGILFVPNTGRSLYSLPDNINELSIDYLILANGAYVYDNKNKKTLKQFSINPSEIVPLTKLAEKLNALCLFFIDYVIYVDNDTSNVVLEDGENLNDLIKFGTKKDNMLDYILKNNFDVQKMCFVLNNENKRKFLEEINGKYDDLYVTSFSDTSIEVSSNKTDKGKALEFLCDYLNIDLKDVVVSGDGENDFPMMDIAGYSITPFNGHNSLKKIANIVSDNVDDNGVVKVYKDLFNLD